MIRTIIADDDKLFTEYFSNIITTLNPDFFISGLADNGEAAWLMIEQEQPQLIFLDIEMPLLNGIEVLRLCSAMKTPPICILISSHKNFSYAQEALKLKAFEYILKPIDIDYIKDLLARIQNCITTKYESTQKDFFSHLLNNYPVRYTEEDISSAFKNTGYFYSYYICIGSYCTYNNNPYDFMGDFWKNTGFDETVITFTSSTDTLWFSHEKNVCFLVLATEKESPDKHKEFVKKMIHFLGQFDCPKTFIYGASTTEKEALKKQFIELDNYGKNHNIFANSAMIDIATDVSPKDIDIVSFSDWQLLSDLITENKFDLFQSETKRIISVCEKNKCTQRKLNGILKRICEIANNNNLPYSLLEKIDEIMSNTNLYVDIEKGIRDIIDRIFQSVSDNNTPIQKISNIKEYIDIHYTEQLSLPILAEKFNFSISYLSTLFKKNYNVSPNEYIIKLRMERAKMLLAGDSNISVKEIAEMVGYFDQYYFSRLFKIYTGTTPSKFRNSICAN